MAKKQVELRQDSIEFETRASGNSGYFSGYAIRWNSVDSYGTYFSKGCCKKTLSERWGDKISERKVKLLWNHQHTIPVGVPVELREDDTGLYFEAELNLDTQLGRELYSLMKQGAINTMSFGFYKINSTFDSRGVENITEISLLEISPVIFESNKEAVINEVRSESAQNLRKQLDDFIMTLKNENIEKQEEKEIEARSEEVSKENKDKVEDKAEERQEEVKDDKKEERAQDYFDTKQIDEVRCWHNFIDNLAETLCDVIYDNDDSATVMAKASKAISDFEGDFLENLEIFCKYFKTDVEARSRFMFINDTQKKFNEYLEKNNMDNDKLVRNTSLTEKEVKALQMGSHFVAAKTYEDVDDELRSIINSGKKERMTELVTLLRHTPLSKADKHRLSALLFTDGSETTEERSLQKEAEQETQEVEERKEEPKAEERSVENILESFLSELKTNQNK